MPFGNSAVTNRPKTCGSANRSTPRETAGSGTWARQAQVRDLRRTRPSARGFPSCAGRAALARFASAACFWPFPHPMNFRKALRLRRTVVLRGLTFLFVRAPGCRAEITATLSWFGPFGTRKSQESGNGTVDPFSGGRETGNWRDHERSTMIFGQTRLTVPA